MISPSLWVLVRYPKGEYSVLSGTSDTWRRSSTIQTVEETDYGWLATTKTSTYKLYEKNIGFSNYMQSVWNYAMNQARGREELPVMLEDSSAIFRAMRNLVKYRSM